MNDNGRESVFRRLGVVPIVNASGIYTDLGGSILSDSIWESLTDLNKSYVDLVSLLDETGTTIAKLVGSEAARITSSASAAIALSVAACIVDKKPNLGEQLPNTDGLRGEVILQRKQLEAYKYLVPLRLSGARVLAAGSLDRTTAQDITNLVGRRTAALFVPAHLDAEPNCVRLEEIAAIGKAYSVPVVVDAAFMSYPPALLRTFAARGATLTCVSAKYFGGPNAGGFISGNAEYVQAVRGMEFTNHESGPYKKFGRAFKMGRYEIAAVALALQEWMSLDHEKRFASSLERAVRLRALLSHNDMIQATLVCFTLDGKCEESPVNAVRVTRSSFAPLTSTELIHQLATGHPSVRVLEHEGDLLLITDTLRDAEVSIVAKRLLEVLDRGPG
jgi:D-glucosaminate-6-phosphate ammonia-lyase